MRKNVRAPRYPASGPAPPLHSCPSSRVASYKILYDERPALLAILPLTCGQDAGREGAGAARTSC
ncbi:hypothetical protein MC885_017679 [Smutsia gigantea]|nr:hypothetical protein MC885_017679 [Smutsia gigantea]